MRQSGLDSRETGSEGPQAGHKQPVTSREAILARQLDEARTINNILMQV